VHRAHAQYARGPASDAELLARHAGLVDRVARRVAARLGRPELADDLWSAGAMGLLDAAQRFDAARDVRFEDFAEHRIRGAMLDEVRKMDHLPRRLRAQVESARKARRALAQELGREATAEELASSLDLSTPELHVLELLAEPLLPLDEELVGETTDGPDAALHRTQLRGLLSRAIGQLSERLQLLLSLHYVEGLTYREVAEVLEVSEPRVCQLHGQALQQLRQRLSDEREGL